MRLIGQFLILALSLFTIDLAANDDWQATARNALAKGAEYLLAHQQADGTWGNAPKTAISALCVVALADTPGDAARRDAAIDKAMEYVLAQRQESGAIPSTPSRHFIFFSDYGYPTYTTAVALLAMATLDKPDYIPWMKQARTFLKSVQVADEGETQGGFGYRTGSRPDMSNTAWAAEALHVTRHLDREPYTDTPEQDAASTKRLWTQLDTFLSKAQNLPDNGQVNPASEDADGGFGYKPGLVSSGSMTYAGLKSMIYAEVDPQDPRVKGVLHYVRDHYTVAENPGQGQRGYFYYAQTMAKALAVLGQPAIQLAGDRQADWRADLVAELAKRQRDNGSWVNTDGRYMESDPNLVTAYAMIALKQILAEE